jgi:hypothetical protein
MGTIIKNTVRNSKKVSAVKSRKQTASKAKLPDLSNDPYFRKKAESASQLLEKYGTPQK